MDSTPAKETRTESIGQRAARGTLKMAGRFVEAAVRQPVITLVVGGAVGSGTATGAVGADAPWLRWALVGLFVLIVVFCIVVLWRSAARRRITELEERNRELIAQIEAVEKVEASLVAEVQRLRVAAQLGERVAAYERHETVVLRGLATALDEGWASKTQPGRFIESNSLTATAEVLAAMLGGDDGKARVELGVAEKVTGGWQTLWGTGVHVDELKRQGMCYVADQELDRVLWRKAQVHFSRGDHYWVEFRVGDRTLCLFALADMELGTPERLALNEHAEILRLTILSIDSTTGPKGSMRS